MKMREPHPKAGGLTEREKIFDRIAALNGRYDQLNEWKV